MGWDIMGAVKPMNHPDYVYRPWPPERRAAASVRAKARLPPPRPPTVCPNERGGKGAYETIFARRAAAVAVLMADGYTHIELKNGDKMSLLEAIPPILKDGSWQSPVQDWKRVADEML